jgi:hypothetical protein
LAGTTLAAAKFKPTVDGKRMVRQYIVYGIALTEWLDTGTVGSSRQFILVVRSYEYLSPARIRTLHDLRRRQWHNV